MAADPLVGKVLADRFEILERIGEGGTGVVYKAKQITVDRDIAIKVLGAHVSSDPQWVKRFHNEARAAAKLHHPNTVQLIDFGQTKEGLLFIAMELLQGHSLRDELDKVQKMPPQRALRIIAQACASVGEAHSQGIIHRDIKPDNLYLVDSKGPGDFVKVLDFSVAKMDSADSQQTRAGIVFGTPSYMSPEQGRGAKLGPQSDVYAFGIVLYEMLNGKPPFDSKIPTEVVMMHLRDKPAPLGDVPEALNDLVMRTLDKDPQKRAQTCEELAAECEGVLSELFPSQTPSGMKAYSTGRHGAVPTGAMKPVAGAAQAQQKAAGGGAAVQQGRPPGQQPQQPRGGSPATAQPLEQKTMIADAPMIAPQAQPQPQRNAPGAGGYGAPPPAAWPPRQQPPSGNANATMAISGPQSAGSGNPAGTMILPDSQGVVAFAMQQAEQARFAAAQQSVPVAKPVSWTFWAAWVVLGMGTGLAVYFYNVHQALTGGAGG